jgi:hypothetical protein
MKLKGNVARIIDAAQRLGKAIAMADQGAALAICNVNPNTLAASARAIEAGANRGGASIVEASLFVADLSGTDLSEACLINGNVTREQFAQAESLKGTKLPIMILVANPCWRA